MVIHPAILALLLVFFFGVSTYFVVTNHGFNPLLETYSLISGLLFVLLPLFISIYYSTPHASHCTCTSF